MHIFNQRGDRLIINRQTNFQIIPDMAIDRMGIPVIGPLFQLGDPRLIRIFHHHGNEIHPRFDQTTSHQCTLPPTMPTITVANRVGFQRQIKGLFGSVAGQNVDRPLLITVHRIHEPRSINLPLDPVETPQQRHPITKPLFDCRDWTDVRDHKVWCRRIPFDIKRRIGRAEIRCTLRKDIVNPPPRIQGNIIRNPVMNMITTLGDDGPRGRSIVDGIDRGQRNSPRHQPLVTTTVVGKRMRHRSDHGKSICHRGMSRHQLTNIKPGDIGRNRMKRPSVFDRGIWLHVVHVHVRWATW